MRLYEHAGEQPPPHDDVAGLGIMHLHPQTLPQEARHLGNQVVCMIAEYHLTSSAWVSSNLCPVLPEAAKPLLPAIKSYLPGIAFEGTQDVRVLDRYCRSCFGIGPGCQCSAVPCQAPGLTAPTLSYSAMVSSTETTASTSAAGVTPLSHLLPRGPVTKPMDMLPPPTTENLLATAGISRGRKPQVPPPAPAAPGLRQARPKMPQQQAPTPGRQEATPYQQQVFPPKRPAPKQSATPSASQDHGDLAGEAGGARGRSLFRGPQDRQRRSRSSTRGSRKRRRADPTDSLMDRMANYVPSGWKRDLTHFIGCCWEAQIGSLEWDEWCVAITKFLGVMAKKKNREWMDIKELTPLQFMPYVAKLFREVTGQDLSGLGHFTGWVGLGGYYHWRVAE